MNSLAIAILVARCWSSTLYFLGAGMVLIILPRIQNLHQTRGDSRVSWFTLESLTTAIGRAAVDGFEGLGILKPLC